ncbi:uncharacterized protein TNCV_2571061 [Trichonephila clavipes]|nr:uncharacterized protein TNCV_2571061 [Trichonephila clavipes]
MLLPPSFLRGSTAKGGTWPSQEAFASLLLASVFQFLVLKSRRSFSRPSIHLRFDLPRSSCANWLGIEDFFRVLRSSFILIT